MKKLLFLLLFLSICRLSAQTVVTYPTSTAVITNPERGFYRHTETFTSSYTPLSQSVLDGYRSSGYTLILRVFYLDNYINSNISAATLSAINTDFTRCRAAGLKMIVRFAYTDEETPPYNPTKAQILTHITQLTPLLQANSDMIYCLQAGFIGVWGEGYFTTPEFGDQGAITATNWNNRKQVLEALLDAVPGKYAQLRTPNFKRMMYGTTALTAAEAYSGSYKARVGENNDCFLSSVPDDYGTYINTALEYPYLAQETLYTPMGGETCNVDPPRSLYPSAKSEMQLFHYSFLNWDYNQSVLSSWGNANLTEVRNSLGYRLSLISATFPQAVPTGTNFQISLSVQNTGYARLLNTRVAEVVFRNTVTGTEIKKTLVSDPRLWGTLTINETITNDLSPGYYKMLLDLPDMVLPNNPLYSIQLANTGLWEPSTGYNDLNYTLQVTAASATCATTTTWNGSAWSNGAPNVMTTAVINGPYTVTGISPFVNFDACNLIVNSTLQINNNRFVGVQNDITVNGTLLVKSGGRLVQVSDSGVNTGNVTIERNTTLVQANDYTYFSSPVSTVISQPLGLWNNDRTFTFFTPDFYDTQTEFQGNVSPGADGQDDSAPFAWHLAGQSDQMIPGVGYAAMTTSTGIQTVSFTGVLNSGIVSVPLLMSGNTSDDTDDFCLVGNPFSSSILADSFIIANLPAISGSLYFWNHNLPLSVSYPGLELLNNTTDDYAIYNLSGGIASASGGLVPSGFIPSCQGFLVEAENLSQPLIFKHELMANGYNNNNFFRESGQVKIRLDLTGPGGMFSQQLIHYGSQSSLGYDPGWDTKAPISRNYLNFYSLEDSQKYKIQSRGYFNTSDTVDLGYFAAIGGDYTITVDSLESVQQVYVREGIQVHTLPFTFHTQAGEFDSRFELVYSQDLNLNQFLLDKIVAVPNPSGNYVKINLLNPEFYTMFVTDSSGRKVDAGIEGDIIHTDSLQSGMYYLTIRDKSNRKVIKLIKQ